MATYESTDKGRSRNLDSTLTNTLETHIDVHLERRYWDPHE